MFSGRAAIVSGQKKPIKNALEPIGMVIKFQKLLLTFFDTRSVLHQQRLFKSLVSHWRRILYFFISQHL